VETVASELAHILLSRKFKKFIKFRFNFFLIFFVFLIRRRVGKECKLFWCRDIFLTYLLSIRSKNFIVCEIHRTPVGLQKYFLKKISRSKRIILAPIGNFLPKKFDLVPSRICEAPMAINSHELQYFDEKLSKKEKIIVYVGLSNQVGIPLNVDLINDAASRIFESFPDWRIEIIGIDPKDFQNNVSNQVSKNITVSGFVPRETVMKQLSQASIGLVIYPELTWFKDSFPIKIVEYAAASLAIVASGTISHTRILNENTAIFFDDSSSESLANSIKLLINDNNLRLKISKQARLWVEPLTYENRVQNVLNALNKLEYDV
jgi:glycosyltransferase involved in cell wall biosynthesis